MCIRDRLYTPFLVVLFLDVLDLALDFLSAPKPSSGPLPNSLSSLSLVPGPLAWLTSRVTATSGRRA